MIIFKQEGFFYLMLAVTLLCAGLLALAFAYSEMAYVVWNSFNLIGLSIVTGLFWERR